MQWGLFLGRLTREHCFCGCAQALGAELLVRARAAGVRAQGVGRQAGECRCRAGGLHDQAQMMPLCVTLAAPSLLSNAARPLLPCYPRAWVHGVSRKALC